MSKIAQTAIIGDNTTLGAYCVIDEGVEIGEQCVIGNHVVIHPGSRFGARVRIDDHAVIGKLPMRAVNSATTSSSTLQSAVMGDDW